MPTHASWKDRHWTAGEDGGWGLYRAKVTTEVCAGEAEAAGAWFRSSFLSKERLQETWVSVSTRRFDEAMATYLLLSHKKIQGAGCKVRPKPGRPHVVPYPSPSYPSSLALGPRRSTSQPAVHSWPLWVGQRQPPEELSGQRGSTRASLPTVPLCLRASAPTLVHAFPLSTCCLSKFSQTLASDLSSSSTAQCPTAIKTPDQTRDTTRGCRGVARRVAACLARLCCCVQAPRTGPGGPNGVAPEPGGRTSPAPSGPEAPHHAGPAGRRLFRNRVGAPWPAPAPS